MLGNGNRLIILDKEELSPVALAIHCHRWEIVSNLLEAGASPFAKYVGPNFCHHSLAFVLFHGSKSPAWVEPPTEEMHRVRRALCSLINYKGIIDDRKMVVQSVCHLLALLELAYKLDIPIVSGFEGDILVLTALINDSRVKSSPFEKNYNDNDAAWAMYTAMRLGRRWFVQMLLNRRITLDERNLDSRHAFASWWPRTCSCDPSLHAPDRRSLREYALALATEPLCHCCCARRNSYIKILRLLQIHEKNCMSCGIKSCVESYSSTKQSLADELPVKRSLF